MGSSPLQEPAFPQVRRHFPRQSGTSRNGLAAALNPQVLGSSPRGCTERPRCEDNAKPQVSADFLPTWGFVVFVLAAPVDWPERQPIEAGDAVAEVVIDAVAA